MDCRFASLFGEQLAAALAIEVSLPLRDTDQKTRLHARSEHAAHLGEVEQLVTDVPDLEFSADNHFTVRTKDHEINLTRRTVPVGHRNRPVQRDSADRGRNS